ncbi:hypothetical protein [Aliarcobacter cryaerophilus]|uniref:hypothetical protein n=1 Tax=Aliarcobacter cryaerophilus TaxID=28198 RepID=UPI0021B600B9|nr:hypothetical protein [Aliarcobacter cryaerophilus]MCT7525502.1 hypothetical protein [Aliarcobacter cryaerophilus]
MKKIINQLFLVLIVIFFSACSSKDVKQFGGNAATTNALGFLVGVPIYGVGVLMEKHENNKEPTLEDKEKSGNLYTEKSIDFYESKLNNCIKSKGITDFNAQDGNQWNREDIQPQLKDCHLRIKNGENEFENVEKES